MPNTLYRNVAILDSRLDTEIEEIIRRRKWLLDHPFFERVKRARREHGESQARDPWEEP